MAEECDMLVVFVASFHVFSVLIVWTFVVGVICVLGSIFEDIVLIVVVSFFLVENVVVGCVVSTCVVVEWVVDLESD